MKSTEHFNAQRPSGSPETHTHTHVHSHPHPHPSTPTASHTHTHTHTHSHTHTHTHPQHTHSQKHVSVNKQREREREREDTHTPSAAIKAIVSGLRCVFFLRRTGRMLGSEGQNKLLDFCFDVRSPWGWPCAANEKTKSKNWLNLFWFFFLTCWRKICLLGPPPPRAVGSCGRRN